MRKIFHLIHLLIVNVFLGILRVWIILLPILVKNNKSKNKIAILPYTPLGWYGGDIRMSNWKSFFQNESFEADVFWSWNKNELGNYYSSNWFKKYCLYTKLSYRRFKIFFVLHKYSSIWIQRAYVPLYPFKSALFEKILTKAKFRWIVDFYDPDYRHNRIFVNQTANFAQRVTVVNKYLKNYFLSVGCKNVEILNLTIDNSKYLIKNTYSFNQNFIIGWMGSPVNSFEVFAIKQALVEIQKRYPFVKYRFICSKFNQIEEINCEIFEWEENTFYTLLNEFDIGIVPISYKENEFLKGKVAMKSLEMMASAIPMVSSPFGVSEFLVDKQSVIFATSIQSWIDSIEILINNINLREKIGKNAHSTFLKYHSYESQKKNLINYITNFE